MGIWWNCIIVFQLLFASLSSNSIFHHNYLIFFHLIICCKPNNVIVSQISPDQFTPVAFNMWYVAHGTCKRDFICIPRTFSTWGCSRCLSSNYRNICRLPRENLTGCLCRWAKGNRSHSSQSSKYHGVAMMPVLCSGTEGLALLAGLLEWQWCQSMELTMLPVP